MALVNPNIAMSFRMPEFTPRNALAEYAALQQIQSGQQAQELARFQLGAAQRAENAANIQNELMAKHFDPTKGGVNVNALISEAAQRGQGGIIPGLLKTEAERQAAAATLEKTRGDIEKNKFDLQKKKFENAWQSAGAAATPQIAIEQLTKAVRQGEIDMASATREIQNLQNMPLEQYRDWRANKILALMDAKDQYAATVPKVMSQFEAARLPILQQQANIAQQQLGVSQGQLNVAQQRLKQEGQTVSIQQDANGNLIAVPTRLAPGATPVARPVTGEAGAPVKGKPSAFAEKAQAQRVQMGKDLDFAIKELGKITEDGGLIDQSTGSGAGRLADIGAGFFGRATPGAIAIGKIAPVADLALKMVPRFEGPQSDKDTASYKEAAGQLADPTLPTAIRKEAGRTVLRLMRERKNQFVTNDMAAEGTGTARAAGGIAPPPGFTPD